MDMKKNWEKVALASIFGVVTILYFIAWIDAGISFDFLGPLAVATFILLLGITAYFICECLEKDCNKWILFAIGAINTLLILLAFINIADALNTWSFNNITATIFVPLAVYALLPLLLGIKKVLNKTSE